MGFGRTERERQLAFIANARAKERLLINGAEMIRTDDIRKYHDPSQCFIYTFNGEGFDFCEVYVRVNFRQNEGNLSLRNERRAIGEYVDGQIVYYRERERDGEEIKSVRELD